MHHDTAAPAPDRVPWTGSDDALTLSFDLAPLGMNSGLWAREVLRRGLVYTADAHWYADTDPATFGEGLGSVLADHDNGRGRQLLVVADHVLLALTRDTDGELHVWAAGATRADTASAVEALRVRYPLRELDDEAEQVDVTFWSLGTHGAVGRRRRIDVPQWKDVRSNYVLPVADELDRVTSDTFVPGAGGQIHLWQGKPGTGKTYALRALAWEWRKWCDLHYVTDPETFFGRSAAYMLEVLLQGDDDAPAGSTRDDADSRAADGRWRLLVLEDAGELMSADAKERTGAGLGRLLNVVDGLIGQGLRILVLVTTNEEVRNLHAAVTRPGRAASVIAFEPFSADAAREWLDDRDHHDDVDHRSRTTAELYAVLDGRERAGEAAAVGFGR